LAGAGVAWYASVKPEAPVPPASAIAPYRLPIAVNGPTVDKEIAFYVKRVKEHPNGFLDANALASAYIHKARMTGESSYYLLAEQSARRSLASLPTDNMGAQEILIKVAIARHQFLQARAMAQALETAKAPVAGLAPFYLTIDLALGQPDEAAVLAKKMLANSPGTENYTEMALVDYALGRDMEAIQAFTRAIELEQPNAREGSALARAWLGRLHLKRGRVKDAADLLAEANRILPGNPVVLGLWGDWSFAQGLYKEAQDRYGQAFMANQGAIFVAAQARALAAAGDAAGATRLRDEAIANLRRDLAGNDFGHRRDLGRLLLETRQATADKEALTLLDAEVAARQDPETLELHAWALGRAGRFAEARTELDRATAHGFQDALVYARQAWVADHLHDATAAARWRARALQINADYAKEPGFQALAADS
jgi:tetratricopeptide (TPR) repeat protein